MKRKRKALVDAYGDEEALKKLAKDLVAKPLSVIQLNEIVENNLRIYQTPWKANRVDISSRIKTFKFR